MIRSLGRWIEAKEMTMKNIILLILISFTMPIYAQDLDLNRFNEYEGTINNKWPIKTSLFAFEDGKIKGTYFYTKHKQKIKLEGIQTKDGIILNEYNDKNKITGIFKGKTFSDRDRFNGTWQNLSTKKEYSFELILESTFPGQWNNRYVEAGINSETDVESFANNIQKYILTNATNDLVQAINFPIVTFIKNERVEIKNANEFRKNYNEIFTTEYIEKLKNLEPINLTASYEGIQFGDKGEIWFRCIENKDGKCNLLIVALNNL
jgi:hypothetical protein